MGVFTREDGWYEVLSMIGARSTCIAPSAPAPPYLPALVMFSPPPSILTPSPESNHVFTLLVPPFALHLSLLSCPGRLFSMWSAPPSFLTSPFPLA